MSSKNKSCAIHVFRPLNHQWITIHSITGAISYAVLHKHLFSRALPQSLKSKSIFLSCVSRVAYSGLKPLQFLSWHISQSSGWTQSRADKSHCMRREGSVQKQLDSLINALATGLLADSVGQNESVNKTRETNRERQKHCLVWWQTCCSDTFYRIRKIHQ